MAFAQSKQECSVALQRFEELARNRRGARGGGAAERHPSARNFRFGVWFVCSRRPVADEETGGGKRRLAGASGSASAKNTRN